MALSDARAAEALRLLQGVARRGGVQVAGKAQHGFAAAYRGAADLAQVWDAVCAATEADVRKCERDHADTSRTVIVLRLRLLGRWAYVKASMKVGDAASVRLLSCKRWER